MKRSFPFLLMVALISAALVLPVNPNSGFAQKIVDKTKSSKSQEIQSLPPEMVSVKGGLFEMGDLFDEGRKDEKPVHQVKLGDYYLGTYEVTVGQFRAFVDETGYKTSAELEDSTQKQEEYISKWKGILPEIQKKIKENKTDEATKLRGEMSDLYSKIIACGGTWCYDADKGGGWSMKHDANWKNPHFEQNDKNPVVCMSWLDAVNYCNWLSKKEELPAAYDVDTKELLDENGNATLDVTKVKGYRLPTEAEWEYAARGAGKKVRFGNGHNLARSSEMNFDATRGDSSYLETGEFRKKTVPVGSFEPNSLGLHDMSGNAWEWCSDFLGDYRDEEQTNPYGWNDSKRALRGGRWGGGASEARVSARPTFLLQDRCNNAGFRIAKTK